MSENFPTSPSPKYIPYSKENSSITACGNPINLDLSKTFKDSTVVVAGIPGAFTGICTEQHIPDYLKHLEQFKQKGVDKIVILSANDPFVLAAWAKALNYTDESNYVVFATDVDLGIAKQLGEEYTTDLTKAGFGVRVQRFASIVKNGEITYLEHENELNFTEIASAETLLKRL